MINKFNTQEDCGPLEELGQFMKNAKDAKGMPLLQVQQLIVNLEKKLFKKGDELFIYVQCTGIFSSKHNNYRFKY